MSNEKIDLPVGLTKREYFAAMALQGLLVGANTHELAYPTRQIDRITLLSVDIADELIETIAVTGDE